MTNQYIHPLFAPIDREVGTPVTQIVIDVRGGCFYFHLYKLDYTTRTLVIKAKRIYRIDNKELVRSALTELQSVYDNYIEPHSLTQVWFDSKNPEVDNLIQWVGDYAPWSRDNYLDYETFCSSLAPLDNMKLAKLYTEDPCNVIVCCIHRALVYHYGKVESVEEEIL